MDFIRTHRAALWGLCGLGGIAALHLLRRRRPARRKLVLHCDINGTIMISDSFSHMGVESAFNYYLSTAVWGAVGADGVWTPSSLALSIRPPSPSAVCYYKYAEGLIGKPNHFPDRNAFKRHVAAFTAYPAGRALRPVFEKMRNAAEAPPSTPHGGPCDVLFRTETCDDGRERRFPVLLPSFCRLLHHLIVEEKRDVCVVLRTYGSDVQTVVNALDLLARGLHPHFPSTHLPLLRTDRAPPEGILGHVVRLRASAEHTLAGVLQLRGGRRDFLHLNSAAHPSAHATTDDHIYLHLSSCSGLRGLEDDYDWWQSNSHHGRAGKPLWVDEADTSVHHLLFDDHARSWQPAESVLDVRVKDRRTREWRSAEEHAHYENVHFVQPDLFETVTDPDSFVRMVERCERNLCERP